MSSFEQITPGSAVPEISLPDKNGQLISLKQLRGKVVLIDFWASWCAPCRKNNPRLAKLYAQWHDRGFEIFGVSVDKDTGRWKEAVEDDKLEWLQVVDKNGWKSGSAADAYHVNGIPASFLLDKQGILIKINPLGRILESEIKTLLKKTN